MTTLVMLAICAGSALDATTPSIPATATDALPAAGQVSAAGGGGDRLHLRRLDGRGDRVQRPEESRGRVRADQERGDRDRDEDAGPPRRPPRRIAEQLGADRDVGGCRGLEGAQPRAAPMQRRSARRPTRRRRGRSPLWCAPAEASSWSGRSRPWRRPRSKGRRAAPESMSSRESSPTACANAPATSNVRTVRLGRAAQRRLRARSRPPRRLRPLRTARANAASACAASSSVTSPKLPPRARRYNHWVNTGVRCAGLRGSEQRFDRRT